MYGGDDGQSLGRPHTGLGDVEKRESQHQTALTMKDVMTCSLVAVGHIAFIFGLKSNKPRNN
jgi:hypothetical protein